MDRQSSEPREPKELAKRCFYKSERLPGLLASVASVLCVVLCASLGGCKGDATRRGQASEQGDVAGQADEQEAPRTRRVTRRDLQGPTSIIGNQALLNRFDDNSNGVLDPVEIEKIEKSRVAKVLERLDLNGDGLISKLEAQAADGKLTRVMARWDEIDTDKSESLSVDELTAALKRTPRRRPTAPKEAVPRQENEVEPGAR